MKKRNIFIALGVLGASAGGGYAVSASNEINVETIDVESLGRRSDNRYVSLSLADKIRIDERLEDINLKNKSLEELAFLYEKEHDYHNWYIQIADRVLDSKLPEHITNLKARCQHMSKADLENLLKKAQENEGKVKYAGSSVFHTEALAIKEALDRIQSAPPPSALPASPALPAPSASNTSKPLDISSVDFATIGLRGNLTHQNCTYSDQRLLEKYTREWLKKNKNRNELMHISYPLRKDMEYCNVYNILNSLYSHWYDRLAWELVLSTKDEYWKNLENECWKMSLGDLEKRIDDLRNMQMQEDGSPVASFFAEDTKIVEKVLEDKKKENNFSKPLGNSKLEEKSSKHNMDVTNVVNETEELSEESIKEFEKLKKFDADEESAEDAEENTLEFNEKIEKEKEKKSSISQKIKSHKGEKDLTAEKTYGTDNLKSEENAYDGASEDNPKEYNSIPISEDLGQYIVQKIGKTNKNMTSVLNNLKDGDIQNEEVKTLANYMAKQPLETFFQPYTNKDSKNIEKFQEKMQKKYVLLKGLYQADKSLGQKILKAANRDSSLFSLDKSLENISKKFHKNASYKNFLRSKKMLEQNFLQNKIDWKKYSDEGVTFFASQAEKIIEDKINQIERIEKKKNITQMKMKSNIERERTKALKIFKETIFEPLKNNPFLMKKIQGLGKNPRASHGTFIKIWDEIKRTELKAKRGSLEKTSTNTRGDSSKKAPAKKIKASLKNASARKAAVS